MAISNPGGNLNSVPASQQVALETNYIDFTSATTKGWAQQYLPDLMEKEAEVFGNRTIGRFLSQVGAEEAMTSDQVIWSEQGRLHLSYTGTYDENSLAFVVSADIDGNTISSGEHGIRINDMLAIATAEGTIKCLVTAVTATGGTAKPYEVATADAASAFSDGGGSTACTMLVIGSEYVKGSQGQGGTTSSTAGYGTVKPTHTSFTNKPIIIKDYYEISGSDASQIGWFVSK